MKKKILVIYHTDLDGAMSAAVVGLKFKGEDITYRLYNYGWSLEPDDLFGYDQICAVDVSFHESAPWVYKLENLIWIDHHKTALEFEDQNPWMHEIPGLRGIGKGACELTWEYFFPGIPKPKLLEYLSVYDVWNKTRFDWDKVEEIEYGAKYAFGISPENIITFIEANEDPENLRQTGYIILANLEKSYRGKLGNNGFYIHSFFGYRLMALNTQDFSSMSFMSHYDPRYFDIMMPFAIIPDDKTPGQVYVRCSWYTENPDIDVSVIAQQFNGGGHKAAAGGIMTLETLQELLSCSCSLKEYMKSIGLEGNKPKRI